MKSMILLSELHITHIRRSVGVGGDREMEHKLCAGMDESRRYHHPNKVHKSSVSVYIFLFHHRIHWDMKRKRYLIMFCLCFQHLIIHQLFACFFLLVFFIDFIILASIFTIPKTLVLRL